MTFQSRLRESFSTHSSRTAIEKDERTFSYRELGSLADRITSGLLQKNVQKGTVIGILLTDRIGIICAMIGVINARCVFVPLDTSLPVQRLSDMITDLDPELIICDDDQKPLIDGRSKPEMLAFSAFGHPGADPVVYPEADKEDSLYVYYTSGSTGVPKGIVGWNASLLQFIDWETRAFSIGEGTRFSQLISPWFDAFLRDVFTPLLAGGTICIPPDQDDIMSPERLTHWIDRSGINVIHCVPSVFRILAAGPLSSGLFPALRSVLMSGEKIDPQELAGWYDCFGERIQLANLYGATETTMIRACYRIQPQDVSRQRIPIGFPIDDTEFVIGNKDLRPCGPLIPGDLYIVSPYISKGYLNAPAATDQRFIKWDAGKTNERPAFRTGDRARLLADGRIELLGREDRQIKLRGIRIELDEIETILQRSALVKNATVIVRTTGNGNDSMAAFVIRSAECPESLPLDSTLDAYLRDQLPAYSIPDEIIEIAAFPLLSNGKIDLKALSNLTTVRDIVPPANETEERLLAIWTGILGERSISAEDKFHKVGGNSLNMMKLIARIHKEFNVRMSLSELFDNLTIRAQAAFVSHSSTGSIYTIEKVAPAESYHASSSQERMYFSQQANKKGVDYNLPMVWQITGEYDRNRLEQAFRLLIDRHESLRTFFRMGNGELSQCIHEDDAFSLQDIRASGGQLPQCILNFIRPFDPDTGPLIRCGIIDHDGKEKLLIVDLHHSICDGMSQSILFREFAGLYRGELLEPLKLQYKDYAEWEYRFKMTPAYFAHREFWLTSLENFPTLHLPVNARPGTGLQYGGGNVEFLLQKDELRPFIDHLQQEGITAFAGIFALYYLFLVQLTGQDDLVVGIATSGRTQAGLEELVGMFAKTLPFRFAADMSRRFTELLLELNQRLIRATSHQLYDLKDIVSDLNGISGDTDQSLFDVLYAFQDYDGVNTSPLYEGFLPYKMETVSSKFPIVLTVVEVMGGYHCRLEYQTTFFSAGDAALLAEQFTSLAAGVCSRLKGTVIDMIGTPAAEIASINNDITFDF